MSDTWNGSWGTSWASAWGTAAAVIPGPTINYQGQGDGDAGKRKKRRNRTHELFADIEATVRRIMAGPQEQVVQLVEPAVSMVQIEPGLERLREISIDNEALSHRLAILEADINRYKESVRHARDEEEAEEIMMLL